MAAMPPCTPWQQLEPLGGHQNNVRTLHWQARAQAHWQALATVTGTLQAQSLTRELRTCRVS